MDKDNQDDSKPVDETSADTSSKEEGLTSNDQTNDQKNTSVPPEESTESKREQDTPADALEKTPEELEEEAKQNGDDKADEEEALIEEKKLPFLKKVFRKVNVYFLGFVLVAVVAGVITLVTYLNSQQPPKTPDVASQTLTTDTLKQLANTDASVGDTSRTLTIQGNAIIAGETLTKGNLNVAGNFQTGGNITTPNITVSGTANLGTTQINSLQVATSVTTQGATTTKDLNVSGASSFSGPMTAAQITVTRLILSGNAVLEIPNHISFTGSSPSRTIDSSVLGSGGTLSINGSDTAGTININTGVSPAAGCFAQIHFQQTYTKQPFVIVSPVGSAAGNLQFYVTRGTTNFSLCTNNAPSANSNFSFDYFVSY